MSMDLVPLTLFCLSMTATPGPNNIVLAATGANHGYRSALPHIAGALVTLPVMCILIGTGLGRLFLAYPALHTALDVVGSAYMLWLAWKITRFSGTVASGARARETGGNAGGAADVGGLNGVGGAAGVGEAAKGHGTSGSGGQGPARPLTFLQSSLFQWLNPKCWMMYIGAVSLFTTGGQGFFFEVLIIAGIFTAMVFPSFSTWALIGAGIGKYLNTRARVLAFNWTLALSLVASLVLAHVPAAAAF